MTSPRFIQDLSSFLPRMTLFLLLPLAWSGCTTNYKWAGHAHRQRMVHLEKKYNPAPEPVPDAETLRMAETPPLAVLQYVVSVAPDARDAFVAYMYENFSINVENNRSDPGDPRLIASTPQLIHELLAKNQYYAMELYQELVETFPEHTVVMRPMELRLDGNGGIHPVSDVEMSPQALTIHFTAFINVRRMMLKGMTIVDDSFADSISPRIFMKTGGETNPPHRIVAGTLPVFDDQGRIPFQLGQPITTHQTFKRFKENQPEWFDWVPSTRPYTGQEPYFLLPFRVIDIKGVNTQRIHRDPKTWSVEAAPYGEYWRIVAETALDVVNTLEPPPESQVYPEYIHLLGLELRNRSAKLDQTVEAMIRAEAAFLQAQDENMVASLYYGPFGKTMRELIRSEFEVRRGQRRANNAMVLNALAGAAGNFASTVAVSQGAISTSTHLQTQSMTLQSNLQAMHQYQTTSITLADLYTRNFAPLQKDAGELVLRMGEEEMEIQANSLQEMREKFRNLLLNLFPDAVSST